MSFYITTPIYYVNAAPHLGHAYTTIAADVMARHHRQRGEDVFFLTGTDEHGEPVADAAKAAGVTPRELADKNAERFRALAPVLDATNDYFIRTSDPRHVKAVQDVLQKVKDNGYVELGVYEGPFCPRCADFKVENEIVEGNRCPIHLIELEWRQEENYFFQLSKLQDRLEAFYQEHPDFVAPASRRNEALSFIRGGLQDVSLTRGKLTWGVPVPWDDSHVFYVWFDALLNYYTALGFAREGEDLTDRFWPATYHFIAKDILKFHCVFWPALLMAADLPLPQHVFVHGYLLMDGHKMSKSLGNVLDPFAVIETFGSDALRFYLLRDVSFGQDGSVSALDFEQRYESELANDYGNLASRTIKMVLRYRDGAVPATGLDPALAADFDGLAERVCELLGRAELTTALEEIWLRVRRLNRYVEEQAPWKLAKEEGREADLDRVLTTLIEGLRVVTVLLHPWIPGRAATLLDALGTPDVAMAGATLGACVPTAVADIAPLFPKHQPPEAA
ncbi:methionine--tRNA ligase [Baekduia soli]|uniref:Methionine--tRNA ligase n=1 Tax=Baekduia soli TaxID=496014 RepID=A0A5B8U3H7_9ACTN|nr:methionine--tRNA ligase [Baekduia soli]QEC47481.1 methionine--tRNA ligase [Baekduia soli]